MVEYCDDAWGNHKVFDANGNEITSASHIGNINPFRYRGYYYDTETKLYYLQSRYYDPETGRFLNMDSLAYADPETINGLNLYSYCNNNPVMGYDPEGTFSWFGLGKILAAVAIIAATAVVAVATAGTAIGVIAAGAAIGGTVGGAISGTTAAITAAANGENVFEAFANGTLSGTITGSISGAVAASPVGQAGQIIFNTCLSGLQYTADALINDKSFNLFDFAVSLGCGALAGYTGGAGALNVAGKAFGGIIYQREVIKAIGKGAIKSSVKYLVAPIVKSASGTVTSFGINLFKNLFN